MSRHWPSSSANPHYSNGPAFGSSHFPIPAQPSYNVVHVSPGQRPPGQGGLVGPGLGPGQPRGIAATPSPRPGELFAPSPRPGELFAPSPRPGQFYAPSPGPGYGRPPAYDASPAPSSSRVTVQQQQAQQQAQQDAAYQRHSAQQLQPQRPLQARDPGHRASDSLVQPVSAVPAALRPGLAHSRSTSHSRPLLSIPQITMTAPGEHDDISAVSSGYGSNAHSGSDMMASGVGLAGSSRAGSFELGNGHSAAATGSAGNAEAALSERAKEKARKTNPLVDLIETETAYVAELGSIIKKVAGAWSRANFPPAELDTMFRNVESIYRINRTFLKSLKEIGPNPSSPRALGDLLMRWIDDMEAPYQRYCDNYFTDFDSWPTIQNNKKLPALLESVSQIAQPDGSPIVYSDKKRTPGQIWSLDQLFALPQTRLKYYKKLYARLLKSTQEGRSDHRLLVGANEKLDELLQHAKNRIAMSVLDEGPIAIEKRQSNDSADDMTANTAESNKQRESSSTSLSAGDQMKSNRGSDEPGGSGSNSALAVTPREYSPLPPLTPEEPPPSASETITKLSVGPINSVDELESRLDTSRVLDIFTMKPKKCQLRMNPPGIPFQRELRKAADVVIHFTPSSTGQELAIRRGHLFLLTDLFLICERMMPSERAQFSSTTGADMWLLYPPLAGKHLRVQDDQRQDNAFSITILKKEKLIVHTDSVDAKRQWLQRMEECQQFGNGMALKVKTENGGDPGPRSGLPTPSHSPLPAISMTPSTSNGPSGIREGETVHDLTQMLDGNHPFSPPSPSPSRTPSLKRDGSFRSFVGETMDAASPPPMERPDYGNGSPAFAAYHVRPPSRQASNSSGPLQPGMIMSPPQMHRPQVMSPTMGLSQSPSGYQGQYGMPNPQQMRDAAPMVPTTRPPAHLLNAANRPPPPPPHGSHDRPPFPANGMNRPPPPGPPGQPNMRPGYGPNVGFQRPPPRPQMSNGPPPLNRGQREPQRRPSEPNLRNGSLPDDGYSRSNDGHGGNPRTRSSSSSGPPRLPSDFLRDPKSRPREDYSPPPSPPLAARKGPKSSSVAAQMRCRLYLKQGHQQWKALGNARLKLYHLMPDDVKQLVVENEKKQTPMISSIIMADGVERVGKVGVAVELSDNGARTGIIYMLHLRSEDSAVALFGQLLEGSDRAIVAA